MRRVRRRRGMALVMALTLIALVGLAVAGGLAHTVASQRAAALSQNAAMLEAAADRALGMVIGDAQAYGLPALRIGESRVFDVGMSDTPGSSAIVSATRLAGDVLWMVGTVAARADTLAGRRVNLVARFPSAGAPPPAAVVTRGTVTIGSSVRLSVDTTQEPDCATGSAAAVIVAPGAAAHVPAGMRVDTAESARDSATFFLTQRQLTLLGAAAGVVHVAGDTTINDGTFDGILIVDGSLMLRGTFVGSGLIVARGVIDASDATVTMRGALLSFAAPSSVSTIFTAGSVDYSPCVVAHVMRVALSPRVVRLRSWAELF